jgi:hypothetical protein
VSTSEIETDRELAIKRMRIRRNARARVLKSKERRKAAIQRGEAKYVSPREYSELTSLHIATVHRRLKSGKLRFKKDGARVLIFADQLD